MYNYAGNLRPRVGQKGTFVSTPKFKKMQKNFCRISGVFCFFISCVYVEHKRTFFVTMLK